MHQLRPGREIPKQRRLPRTNNRARIRMNPPRSENSAPSWHPTIGPSERGELLPITQTAVRSPVSTDASVFVRKEYAERGAADGAALSHSHAEGDCERATSPRAATLGSNVGRNRNRCGDDDIVRHNSSCQSSAPNHGLVESSNIFERGRRPGVASRRSGTRRQSCLPHNLEDLLGLQP